MTKKIEIYIENTNGVEITVRPEYVDSQINLVGVFFVWVYYIRIHNQSNETLQLTDRYWKIIDEKGGIQEVSGEGVIGKKPILTPGADFEYSSGVHLRYKSGIMLGHYVMKKENGETFNAKIPAFSLDIPGLKEALN